MKENFEKIGGTKRGTYIRIQYNGNKVLSIKDICNMESINYNTLNTKKNRSNKSYIELLKEEYNVNIEKIGNLYYYRDN